MTGALRLPDWPIALVVKVRTAARIRNARIICNPRFEQEFTQRPGELQMESLSVCIGQASKTKLLSQLLLFRTSASRAVKSGNLLTDDWVLRSFINIYLSPVLVLVRNVSVGEDRFNRTLWNTRVTIDASIGIDI